MKWTEHRLLLPVYVLLIFFTAEIISKPSRDKWSWFQAQKICMDDNDTLKLNELLTSTTYYWSGVYLRYSFRIHILGCYSTEIDTVRTNKKFVMKYPSVGFCQEICATESIFKFGIQAEKCVCFGSHISARILPPSECNETCTEYTEGVSFTDCGGRNAYTMYTTHNSENVKSRKDTFCSAIACGTKKTFFNSQSCSELFSAFCKVKDTDLETKQNWTQSMQFCKTSLPSSYLVGDISLVDATSTCENLNRTQKEFAWLGVMKGVHLGNDRGVVIDKNDRGSFHQCQKCNEDGCQFDDCSVKLKTIRCEKGLQIEATTRDIIYSQTTESEASKTTFSQPSHINDTTKTYGTHKDSSTPVGIIVSLVIASVLILCSGIAIFLYIRKKKSNMITKDSKFQKSKVKSINNAEQNDEHFADVNYFVLEPTSESSRNPYHTKEDVSYPYMEIQEGNYDHLQDNYKRKKESENMYDHTTTGIEQDYGGYGIGKNKENIEDTYDHASPSSDYGHVTHVQTEQINSEYDKVIKI